MGCTYNATHLVFLLRTEVCRRWRFRVLFATAASEKAPKFWNVVRNENWKPSSENSRDLTHLALPTWAGAVLQRRLLGARATRHLR
jgi:hypothetical protein